MDIVHLYFTAIQSNVNIYDQLSGNIEGQTNRPAALTGKNISTSMRRMRRLISVQEPSVISDDGMAGREHLAPLENHAPRITMIIIQREKLYSSIIALVNVAILFTKKNKVLYLVTLILILSICCFFLFPLALIYLSLI